MSAPRLARGGQRPGTGAQAFGQVLANAQHYMTVLGHVAIGWMWLWQATVAQRALPTARGADADFYRGKLQAARWFFACELPQVELAARLVREADDSAFGMKAEWF